MTDLWAKAAIDAVAQHPNSHIEVALSFLKVVCPEYLLESNDRLLKIGRRIAVLVEEQHDLQAALEPLVRECRLLVSGQVKVHAM